MPHTLNRRAFLALSTASYAAGVGAWAQSPARPLPLIRMTDLTAGFSGRIGLTLNAATHDFGTGAQSKTFGINRDYLGPVLKVKQGQTLPFDVINDIGDVTTLHWHGLHIPGAVDGGPHQEIAPGSTWSPDVPIVQHASMNWFHSHTHGKTAQQTYKGLAGVMLIEDDASLSADLPKTYGVDDFTLVLQDKMFNGAGQMTYEVSTAVFEDGFMGDTLVVNGTIAPTMQTVPKGLVRLRILNACNAQFLTLSMSTGPINVIASDGGFLGRLVETESLEMSPGERYEILVDMSDLSDNSLMVTFEPSEAGLLSGLWESVFGGASIAAVTLVQTSEDGFTGSMPKDLANLSPPDASKAVRTRSFELNMGDGEELASLALLWGNVCGVGMVMGINGQPMNMDRIDEEVRLGDTEIWRIRVDDQHHPFHIHGCSFRVLKQEESEPPAYAQGWKDMVRVENGWSEVLVKFDHEAHSDTPYMYHCHILEHEDCGMMGQFTVTS